MSADCCMLPRRYRYWGLVAASGGLMTTAAAMRPHSRLLSIQQSTNILGNRLA